PSFTVPTQHPVALPPGWYRLRVSGPGRLSETYQLLVEQGEERHFAIGASDRLLWESPVMHSQFQQGRALTIAVAEGGGKVHTDAIAITTSRSEALRPPLIERQPNESERPDPVREHLRAMGVAKLDRIDGRTGTVVWHRGFGKEEHPALAAIPDKL